MSVPIAEYMHTLVSRYLELKLKLNWGLSDVQQAFIMLAGAM